MKALNTVAPYDWKKFWETRLNALSVQTVIAGIDASGYDYVESDKMPGDEAKFITTGQLAEMYHSLGFLAVKDGTVADVWVGSLAYVAGMGPGDKLTAVNGKPYAAQVLIDAVREAKTGTAPITLTAVREDETKDIRDCVSRWREVRDAGAEREAGCVDHGYLAGEIARVQRAAAARVWAAMVRSLRRAGVKGSCVW